MIKRLQGLKPRVDEYGPDDLADRLVLLAILYKESNCIQQAVQTMREAKRLCIRNRIPFDSSNLLTQFEAELLGGGCKPAKSRS